MADPTDHIQFALRRSSPSSSPQEPQPTQQLPNLLPFQPRSTPPWNRSIQRSCKYRAIKSAPATLDGTFPSTTQTPSPYFNPHLMPVIPVARQRNCFTPSAISTSNLSSQSAPTAHTTFVTTSPQQSSISIHSTLLSPLPQGYYTAIKDRFRHKPCIYHQFISTIEDHSNHRCVI